MALLLVQTLLVVFTEVLLNACVVGFLPPFSPLRLAVLPVIVLCVYNVLPLCLEATGRVMLAALLGAHSIGFLLQYIDTALISRWSAEYNGPRQEGVSISKGKRDKTPLEVRPQTFWQRLRFGLYAAVNTRNVGTSHEIGGVPSFSTHDPSYVPSRSRFITQKIMTVALCYLTIDLITFVSEPELNHVRFHSSRIPLTDPANRTFEQLIIRVTSMLGFCITLYSIIQLYMGLIALLAVASGLQEVQSWPPGFGSPWEAYSLRRFWGVFWHKYQRQKMVKPAAWIAHDVLRMRKGTQLSRYTQVFLTFLISGCVHALTEIAEGIPSEQSGAIRFFCTQVAGIALEDVAQRIYEWIVQARQGSKANPPRAWRLIGYVWTAAFLFWSTPVWIYPSIYQNRGEGKDLVLPFSVIEMAKQNLT